MKPILVTGGTGTLGRVVVDRLLDAGREVRVVSRRARPTGGSAPSMTVDLRGGEGIDAAVAGVDGRPQVRSTPDLARAYLRASGRHRLVLPVRLPGAVFAAYRRGGHLAPGRTVGRITFDEFLAERLA